MQPIRQIVWDKMNAILQVGDKQPNYKIEARRDSGEWVTIPKERISSIDIDTRLDFEASTCDFKLVNDDGSFTPEIAGVDGAWKTVFKDDFQRDSKEQYTLRKNFEWSKDVNTEYGDDGIRNDGYNGYATSGRKPKDTVSELEFSVNIANKGRFNFDFRKTNKGGDALGNDGVIWYDNFTKGLKPQYVFTHDSKADNWAIRDYSAQGGKKVMSSGYSYGEYQYSNLELPIDVPCRCIVEYKHRLFIPRQRDKNDNARKRHRFTIDGGTPAVPPIPVNIPEYTSLDASNGGIEFKGNHAGHGTNYERHQHILPAGQHRLKWATYYYAGRMLARWEMDYIKIFAYDEAGSITSGSLFEVLIDDVVIKSWTSETVSDGFTKAFSDWYYINTPGRHKIKFRVTHNSYVQSQHVDIDNILVQDLIPGSGLNNSEYNFGYLLMPNTEIKVWTGYGDSDDDLVLKFTGLIDKIILGTKGYMEVKCRDMYKKLKDTMVKPKPGEYSITYPTNPMDDFWWVASDIIADLINKAGCIAIVERTMIEENGVEVPYVVPKIQFQEGKSYADCVKEIADGINFRCWANRNGDICLMKYRFKGQADEADFEITEFVDLTDLELVLDDADVRGKLRIVCTANNQAEIYVDEFLQNEVCKGMDRYASAESQWMETQAQRQKMAEFMFMQMKRKFRTKTFGTVGNPYADVWDFVKVLETITTTEAKKYTITGIRTSISDKGYVDIYDCEYGADKENALIVEYAWGDSKQPPAE